MKKMLLKFADNLLSREQMKNVKGGGYNYACYVCTNRPSITRCTLETCDRLCDSVGQGTCTIQYGCNNPC